MNSMQGVQQMRAFVDEMWQSGLCRTITVRYSTEGMLVSVEYASNGDSPTEYIFTWEDA